MNQAYRLTVLAAMVASFVACQPKNKQTERTTVIKENSQAAGPQTQNSGGVDVGNGGDAIRCNSAAENSLSGLYALDFLLTESPSAPKTQAVKSWEESRDRIFGYLNKIHPQLARSFYDFYSQMDNHASYEADRIWEASTNDLLDIKDEKLIKKLPANCVGQKSAQFYQAVIRQKKATHTTYHYAQDLISELKLQPLQFSFLMVHEWLWDFTNDVSSVRQLNRLLHSNQLETMTRESLLTIIGNLGMKVSLPLIDRGLYAPQSGVRANTDGDFSRCTVVPEIMGNPRKIFLHRGDSPHSCWNFDGVNSLSYICKIDTTTVCTIDKEQFDLTVPNAVYDVETVEILSHRHLVLTFVPGPKRKNGMQVHYYYSDYQIPMRPR